MMTKRPANFLQVKSHKIHVWNFMQLPCVRSRLLSGLQLKEKYRKPYMGNRLLIAYVLHNHASLNQPTYANFIPSGYVCVYLKSVHLSDWKGKSCYSLAQHFSATKVCCRGQQVLPCHLHISISDTCLLLTADY